MKVRLLLFAVLRDIAGRNEEVLTLADGTSAADVWETLRREHPRLSGFRQPPLVAINESYAAAGTSLHDGDELAFIPPVSGG